MQSVDRFFNEYGEEAAARTVFEILVGASPRTGFGLARVVLGGATHDSAMDPTATDEYTPPPTRPAGYLYGGDLNLDDGTLVLFPHVDDEDDDGE
ncbi:MAG: hypothetical protein M1826_004022 [Phylliscum demangeonii]|nr:MAG: hypothetical protein M1826_004022 [Phylliscum demangeonii]